VKLRPEVQWFAEQMERRLRAKDAKRGGNSWKSSTSGPLLDAMLEETEKLKDILISRLTEEIKRTGSRRGPVPLNLSEQDRREVIRESADVANYAMMVADVIRCPKAQEKARP